MQRCITTAMNMQILNVKQWIFHVMQVVFLDFNHHYAMDVVHHMYLINMLQEMFGSKLCQNCAVETITLDYLWGKKHQVRIE